MKSTPMKYVIAVVLAVLIAMLTTSAASAEEVGSRHWIGKAKNPGYDIPQEVTVIQTLDRTKPIYEVYKSGVAVDVPVEWQWYIRDLCTEHDLLDLEPALYGLILTESTFTADIESFDGGCFGLAQIGKYWITTANITHFTDDYRSRDLFDPYDNILTMTEMVCYARDAYGLDFGQKAGKIKYLYWHNTGKDPTRVKSWDYATEALGYADELVMLQS